MQQRQAGHGCCLDRLGGPFGALGVVIGDVDNPGNAGLAQGQIALGDLGHLMGMARLGGGQQACCKHQIGALLPFQLNQPLVLSCQ